ncbi:MAG: LapA family protein [Pirellulaceae bacterium]
MARLKVILILVLLLIVGLIAYVNRGVITLNLLVTKVPMPGSLLIFVTALLGFAVGVIFGSRIPRKLKVTTVPPPEKKPAK